MERKVGIIDGLYQLYIDYPFFMGSVYKTDENATYNMCNVLITHVIFYLMIDKESLND